MIELNVKFYEVKKDGLPKKSGDYLCFVGNRYYTSLSFSTRHQAFNCRDFDSDTDTKIEDVTFWANYPTINRKIEVDDIVTFRSDLVVDNRYGGVDLLSEMSDCMGRKFKVEQLVDNSENLIKGRFLDTNKTSVYIFSKEMLSDC